MANLLLALMIVTANHYSLGSQAANANPAKVDFSVAFMCKNNHPEITNYVIRGYNEGSQQAHDSVIFRSDAYPVIYIDGNAVFAEFTGFRQDQPGFIRIGSIDLKNAACSGDHAIVPIQLRDEVAMSLNSVGKPCQPGIYNVGKVNTLTMQLVDGETYDIRASSCQSLEN